MRTEPYTMLIATEGLIAPHGNGYITDGFVQPGVTFKALRAERVDGIDYSAFKINSIFVGQIAQWINTTKGPVPAEKLFEYDVPMTTMRLGLDVTISFTNTSDKPQRFAVKLVGEAIR